jgi:hypothetical protein
MAFIEENEKNNYGKAIAAQCPINAGINRILVIQIRPEYEKDLVTETNMPVVKKGELWLPEHAVAATEKAGGIESKNEVVKAIVKSCGPTIGSDGVIRHYDPYPVNSMVYVFPSVFETMITIDEVDYMSYSARDIVAGVDNKHIPPILEKEMD